MTIIKPQKPSFQEFFSRVIWSFSILHDLVMLRISLLMTVSCVFIASVLHSSVRVCSRPVVAFIALSAIVSDTGFSEAQPDKIKPSPIIPIFFIFTPFHFH